MIADVIQATPVRRYDLSGDLLPREETSLGPVDYRRIPAADPVGYVQTTQQARHASDGRNAVHVPALTAMGTAVGADHCGGGAGVAVRLAGKNGVDRLRAGAGGGWFWRLGFADKVLVASRIAGRGKDLDGDGYQGAPVEHTLPRCNRTRHGRRSTADAADGTGERLAGCKGSCIGLCRGVFESAQGIKPGIGRGIWKRGICYSGLGWQSRETQQTSGSGGPGGRRTNRHCHHCEPCHGALNVLLLTLPVLTGKPFSPVAASGAGKTMTGRVDHSCYAACSWR